MAITEYLLRYHGYHQNTSGLTDMSIYFDIVARRVPRKERVNTWGLCALTSMMRTKAKTCVPAYVRAQYVVITRHCWGRKSLSTYNVVRILTGVARSRACIS